MSDFVTNLLFILVVLYLMQTAFFVMGTFRLNYPRHAHLPFISILVAVRNEEQWLQECISCLLEQDYPPDKMEIIFIDDRSTDRTPEILASAQKQSSLVRLLNISQCPSGFSGKAHAISKGLSHSRGEIVLVTDGDCRPPRSWARTHVAYYTHDVGMVGGFTLLDDAHTKSGLFEKVQSLDWTYLLSVGTGAMGFGLPLSILGNNFSFRKTAYEEVGGYAKMGFTIIEDFALMKALLRQTRWRVCYPIDTCMLVTSRPMPSLPAFVEQRKRWAAGGKEVGLYGKFLMSVATAIHLVLPATFMLTGASFQVLVALGAVLVGDFVLLFRTTGLIRRRDLLKCFLPWEIFYFLYTILFAPVLLFPTTVTWKGTSYKWKFNMQLDKSS